MPWMSSGLVSMRARITFSPRAASQPPSKLGLAPGQKITVEEAIQALAIKSAGFLLTAVVVGVFVGVVALVTHLTSVSSQAGVAAATLICAAAVNPFRKRLQRAVDRRFNRAPIDAARTIDVFARGGGNAAYLNADDGNTYYYAHFSAYVGGPRAVAKGEVIGLTGMTGNATAPHLHFEIRLGGPNGNRTDPYPTLKSAGC